MPLKDVIKNQLSDADKIAIEKAVSTIEATILGKTVVLTPDERKDYGSINEQNKLVIGKIADYHQTQAQFDSPFIDWNEFESDNISRHWWELILGRIEVIARQGNDTKILHDYDSYQTSLKQYDYVSTLVNQDVPGADVIKSEVGQFFSRTSSAPAAAKTNP